MHSTLADLVASGVSLFGQGTRLLKLRFPESSGLGEETLLPHRLVGEEGLSENYRYTLDCLSADTHLELKRVLGQPVEIALLLPDSGARLLTGLVTHAAQNGADGGFAQYVLTLEPALATLRHRRNSRVFQDQSVPQIVCAVLDEHLATNPAFTGVFQYLSTKGGNVRRLLLALKSLRFGEKSEISQYLRQVFFGQFMLYFLPIGQEMLYRHMNLVTKGLMLRTCFALLPGHFTGNGTRCRT